MPLFTELPGDQQIFMSEPVQLPMNTAGYDAPFPIQESSGMHHFSPAHEAAAGVGQISPAEGTQALGQYSPLEGAFIGTQEHMAQPDPGAELPVQSTPNDSGMTSAFVLQITVIVNL